jgi:hypothetical protein
LAAPRPLNGKAFAELMFRSMVTEISFVSLLCSGGGTHVDETEEDPEVELNLTCSDVVFPAALVLEVRNVGAKDLFLDRRLAVTNRLYPG